MDTTDTTDTDRPTVAGWINPHADLVGVDGNAFAVMGYTCKALRRAGNSDEVVAAYQAEAMGGDYDTLLGASMRYCGMLLAGVEDVVA